MSGVSSLFSDSKKDASISSLFASSSAGPVKKAIKERTIIEPKKSNKPKADKVELAEDADEEMKDISDEEQIQEAPKRKKKRSADEDDDLESRYLDKILDDKEEQESKPELVEKEESDDSDSDSETDEPKPVKSSEAKKIDFKEDEVEKAERTIFVGNLSSNVITSKTDYKAFKKHFSKYGEIDSIRFRSIAFNEALPRKVAFVQQKLHTSRDSVNSYIVFKSKDHAREALKSNGEVFLNLHLRVDSISHPAKIDNKRAIFVGNLDFEEKEEELWNIFSDCGEIEFVRIVRDAKTNVGKGFGYVQFKDFLAVSKALMLHEKKLGEKKRKLRITRSKKMSKPRENAPSGNFRNSKQIPNLTDNQKTKLGRAKRVLGKADRATAGQQVIEGMRAKKGEGAVGIKFGKNRVKKPRIRQRSTDFKKARATPNK